MVHIFSRYWWAFAGRGIFAVIYISFAIVWPGITGEMLIHLFGAYIFIDGTILAFKAVRNWHAGDERILLLLEGILGIGIGSLTFLVPSINIKILTFYIVAWTLATGAIKIVEAIRLRKEMIGEWWLLLSGFASVVLAFLLLAFFDIGTVGLAWMIVVYAYLYGIMLSILSIKLRKEQKESHP